MVRLLALLLTASAPPAAQAPTRVEPGIFLVSKPSIANGPFHKSVVLVLAHGEDGTVGVIVNRDTGVPLAEALPGLDDEDGPHELYFGGPVAMDGLMFVFRSDEPRDDADPVVADMYYSGVSAVLESLLEEERSVDELRLYLGHAGWSPGQLEGEILRGDWEFAPADPPLVFTREPETLWDRLSKSGRITARASRPGRPASRTAAGRAFVDTSRVDVLLRLEPAGQELGLFDQLGLELRKTLDEVVRYRWGRVDPSARSSSARSR